MATSGSVDFVRNRDELITDALKLIGEAEDGETPSANQLAIGSTYLNYMLKAWQAYGLNIWVLKTAIIALQKGKESYLFGPNGDHIVTTLYETTLTAAVAASDTVMPVADSTGMANADVALVYLTDGTTHADTIASVDSSTQITLTTGVASAAASGKAVKAYTASADLADRPLEITDAYRRESSGNDVPLDIISREEYIALSDKDTEGTTVSVYFDPQLTDAKLHTWPAASTATSNTETVRVVYRKPFDDMDATANDFEFPQEWLEAIMDGLCYRMAKRIGHPLLQAYRADAAISLELAMTFDGENNTSVFFGEKDG